VVAVVLVTLVVAVVLVVIEPPQDLQLPLQQIITLQLVPVVGGL